LKSNSITVDIGLPEFRVVRYKRSKNRYEIWLEKGNGQDDPEHFLP